MLGNKTISYTFASMKAKQETTETRGRKPGEPSETFVLRLHIKDINLFGKAELRKMIRAYVRRSAKSFENRHNLKKN